MTTDAPLHIKGKNNVQPGQVPTDDDLYWVGAMRLVFVDSLRTTHVSAIAVFAASLLGWGITACVLAFGNASYDAGSLVVWLLPVLIWSAAIVWSLRVLTMRRYRFFANSPDSSRQAIMRIARRKSHQLFWAVVLWCAGVVAFAAALTYQLCV